MLTHYTTQLGPVAIHYVTDGPESGPVVMLLHGFPDCWETWRHQMPALAAAGYRVVAPDLRGYNLSAKPSGVEAYRPSRVAGDVVALIRHLGASRVTLVGHDWGGIVAWYVTAAQPSLVARLAVLNAPHPRAFARELYSPLQLLRSWYVFFFQIPRLPEALLRARRFAILRHLFRTDPRRAGAFGDEDIERAIEAAAQPGALEAMVNYYRAMVRYPDTALGRATRDITTRTMVIWGEHDRYLDEGLLDGLERWVPWLRVERLPDASIWAGVRQTVFRRCLWKRSRSCNLGKSVEYCAVRTVFIFLS